MAKRKTKKQKRAIRNTLGWISGIALALFIVSGTIIAFDWISANKTLIFAVSGLLLLVFLVSGIIRLKFAEKVIKRAIKKKF